VLQAKIAEKDRIYLVVLNGAVDDEANLDAIIGALPESPTEFHVNCAGINRINSVGVKGWIKFFQKVQAKKLKIVFWDCSPPIVQQMNLVFNFTCGGTVQSLQGSFACEGCGNNFLLTLPVKNILASRFNIPDQKCPKCSGVASFDDLPKMYFKFLMAT
jgi:anti-anti-sigma regulatory factor